MPEKPDPDGLIPINMFERDYPIRVNLVYAQADHPDNHFGQLYHPEAKILWLHKDLARIVLTASKIAQDRFGWRLRLLDGLRPVEAQIEMQKFGIPWQMLARPGQGGHPRGMAIDIVPENADGSLPDMGTPFDQFVEDYERDINYADRSVTEFGKGREADHRIVQNRQKLTFAMEEAARLCGAEIWPLPHEWWDFRIPKPVSDQFAPLREADLHPFQRLISPDIETAEKILNGELPGEIRESVAELYKG